MRLEFGLLALAGWFTDRAVPESGLIFPALGFFSAIFFDNLQIQLVLVLFSCILWILSQS